MVICTLNIVEGMNHNMKKIFIIILLFFSLMTYFYKQDTTKLKEMAKDYIMEKDINKTEDYIETIPKNASIFINQLKTDDIILTSEDIEKYNQKIKEKTSSMYDLTITTLSKNDVENLINMYKVPSLPKYNNNKEVTKEDIDFMKSNQNISNINTDSNNNVILKKAIVIKRSNLRSFPTDTHLFKRKNLNNFDQLQETELTINQPVLIAHESKDNNWKFIISKNYAGWVKSTNLGYATEEDWEYFTNNKNFGIITEPIIEIEDLIFDMGVKLPYIKTTNNEYQFAIPTKDKNNYITKKFITLKRNQAHIGYLPYTNKNLIIQAFKYENLPYSWAGMDKSVDCSSYILNIYKTFGLSFPRNTSSQKDSVGNITWLKNKSNQEKLNILSSNPLSLLYQPGHVMLYLGKKNEQDYIIHASGNDLKITVTKISENSIIISKIDRLITIS